MKAQVEPGTEAVEFDDIQGVVRFGYKHLTQAVFLLLRVKNPGAARAWLATVPVTSAVTADPPPQTALHIAFTSEGMRALEVAPEVVASFSHEFVSGMSGDESRARRLGDVAGNAPDTWHWGAGQDLPHVLVMIYAVPGLLDEFAQSMLAGCKAGFEVQASLATSDMDGVEPFGFLDGISQPELDWNRQLATVRKSQVRYRNLACLGEFLLGYPNEYGHYTDRPLLAPSSADGAMLARAEDAPDRLDLGRNGTYLVFRQLQQDVQGFWQFLHRAAGGDVTRRDRRAAAMVGRTQAGEPLARRSGESVADGVSSSQGFLNDFTYQDDPHGFSCPIGAHIRRSNPRNPDLPPGKPGFFSRLIRELGLDENARNNDLVASTRFHRLLRRGREYGANLTIDEALAGTPAGVETGLHFICLNASIGRQFEFVQGAWVAGTKFGGLRSEGDGLLGHRQPGLDGMPSDVFSMPRPDGPDEQLCGLPQFVRVLGGAYFFLPGIRALRYLVTAR